MIRRSPPVIGIVGIVSGLIALLYGLHILK